MKNAIKKYVLPPVISLVFIALYFYLAIPAINIRYFGFWMMLVLTAAVYVVSYVLLNVPGFIKRIGDYINASAQNKEEKKSKKAKIDYYDKDLADLGKKIKLGLIIAGSVIALFILICIFTSTRIFRADDYQDMLNVTESDFAADIAEMPISQIPIVDRDTAERLGSRKIGEVVELVSQFDVSDYYSQINYRNKPYRVSPLQYADILKWFVNKEQGIPYYISIDMATQETELIHLDEGIKYSPSEFFARDLYRHIRFAHPTKMFENLSFEINDEGHPYWVMSYYNYSFGILGGKDIIGIILVDAVSGEMTNYKISDVPQWIDLAYSPELVLEQANNWGSLKNGFINSIFVQKDVVVTTDGYNYIAVDDDVWLYTGITSVSADESNIGFILINMRTKEAKTYMINGAEEYSAMESAQGKIQEKGYVATFPILINVADRPSYFISLKDNAGLVKAYAYVSVSDYQIVGVADTIEGAQAEYMRMLGVESNLPENDPTDDVSGTISMLSEAVVNGNTVYYIMLNDTVYTAEISVSDMLPFLKAGDNVTLSVTGKVVKKIVINE